MTMSALAGLVEMDRTTLTRNLKPLADAGLVEIVPGDDARSRVVSVTARGRDAWSNARELWRQAQDEVNRALGGEQVAALHATLDESLARLKAEPASTRTADKRDHVLLVVVAAASIMALTFGMRMALSLFISAINTQTGVGLVAISLAFAVAQLMWGVSQPIAGAIADRYGAGRVIAGRHPDDRRSGTR